MLKFFVVVVLACIRLGEAQPGQSCSQGCQAGLQCVDNICVQAGATGDKEGDTQLDGNMDDEKTGLDAGAQCECPSGTGICDGNCMSNYACFCTGDCSAGYEAMHGNYTCNPAHTQYIGEDCGWKYGSCGSKLFCECDPAGTSECDVDAPGFVGICESTTTTPTPMFGAGNVPLTIAARTLDNKGNADAALPTQFGALFAAVLMILLARE